MKIGKVVIISDEEQILNDKFEFDVMDEKGHVMAYQEFSDKYKLGFRFSSRYYGKTVNIFSE